MPENCLQIIDKYYSDNAPLREILLTHSRNVACFALSIVRKHGEWGVDEDFVFRAAMLHDIGIYLCDAKGIECFGTEPYIRHGILGAEILRREGLPREARIAERHTGAGLSREDIVREALPLPHKDFLPETLEEKVICYADKFFSKTHPDEQKTLASAERSLMKFGGGTLLRFRALHALVG